MFKDEAAIRVVSANEDRHPDNQPILTGGAPYGDSKNDSSENPYGN